LATQEIYLEREEKKAKITSDYIFLLYDFMFILWMKGRERRDRRVV
jgi:hypothetical protein